MMHVALWYGFVGLLSILGWEWMNNRAQDESAPVSEFKWWGFAVAAVLVGWFWFKRKGRV